MSQSLDRIKSLIRRLFYRFPFFRAIVALGSISVRRTKPIGILHLLSYTEEAAIGPLQQDEAIALFGIIRTTRPATILEFGFFHGHSAFNFLCASADPTRVYSYDIYDESLRRAREEFASHPRLTFIHKSQTEFEHKDIDERPIDFVFFDAAHDFELNTSTFRKIHPYLSQNAIIAVHDTGLWARDNLLASHKQFVEETNGYWIDSGYAHQPDERRFVNWITSTYEGLGVLHLHTMATLRHGLSLIQKQAPLP